MYIDTSGLKEGYQTRINLVKDEKVGLLAGSRSILSKCKNY
jgi:hypothetical protein